MEEGLDDMDDNGLATLTALGSAASVLKTKHGYDDRKLDGLVEARLLARLKEITDFKLHGLWSKLIASAKQ